MEDNFDNGLTGTSYGDNQLTNNEMSGIYLSLSVSGERDIDNEKELEFVQTRIDSLFNDKLKHLPTETLSKNTLLVNKLFLELIKSCKLNSYKRMGFIFLGFCDYFDLDCSRVYSNLHEKIQYLIQLDCMKLIGAREYERRKEKNNKTPDIKINSLFSLIKK